MLHLSGELVKPIMFELKDDNCVEPQEQFFIDLSLSNDTLKTGVQLSSESYTVKICDNDGKLPDCTCVYYPFGTYFLYFKKIMLYLPLMQAMVHD